MMTLTLEPWGGRGISVHAPIPLPTNESAAEWNEVATRILSYAFSGRPVCFVTDDERASSFPYADGLPDTYEIVVDGARFLLAFVETATPARLERAVASSEFRWDAVWFMPLHKQEMWRVDEFIRNLDVRAPEKISEEVVMPFGDGCGLEWLNTHKDIDDVIAELSELTRTVGWTLDQSALDK